MERPSPTDAEPPVRRRNPNITDRPPWREFAIVGSIVAGVAVVIYLILGWIAGAVVTRLPADVENRWGDVVVGHLPFPVDADAPSRVPLQELVDRLALPLGADAPRLVVHIVDDPLVNAAALPGGHVLVFGGLLEEVHSENELAMILAHEIAHHVHRDHLRQIGRKLLVSLAANALLGADSAAGHLLSGSAGLLDLSFSRTQEAEADRLGLTLLEAHYGHVGGALDFFERHRSDDNPALQLLQTHPLSAARVDAIARLASEEGFSWRDPSPLPDWTSPGP